MSRLSITIIILLILLGCNKNLIISPDNTNSYGSVVGIITDRYCYPISPVPNARVSIRSASYSDSTHTDSSGAFKFVLLRNGVYTLEAVADIYDTLDTTFTMRNADTLSVSLELPLIYEYELGTVLAGFQDTATVTYVFQLCSNLGLSIKKLKGFDHKSKISVDSLSFVRTILQSKNYLVVTDYTVFSYGGAIWYVGGFRNLDSVKVADWIRTQNQLKFISVSSPYRDGNIQTQEGQEVVWIRALRNYPVIRWLTLNYLIPIDPHP